MTDQASQRAIIAASPQQLFDVVTDFDRYTDWIRDLKSVEVVAAIVSASIRPFTPMAFGFLVPVYGLGLCGLWGARYGTFAPRAEPGPSDDPKR